MRTNLIQGIVDRGICSDLQELVNDQLEGDIKITAMWKTVNGATLEDANLDRYWLTEINNSPIVLRILRDESAIKVDNFVDKLDSGTETANNLILQCSHCGGDVTPKFDCNCYVEE